MAETTDFSITEPEVDKYSWVAAKIGTNYQPFVDHVTRQVAHMGLTEDAGLIEILHASMITQARVASIFGDFSDFVRNDGIIDIGEDMVVRGQADDLNVKERYEKWMDQNERSARLLIDKGMDSLKRFDFAPFWDDKLWKRLTYSHSHNLLMDDAMALLKVVLCDAPESEQEVLIAMALAERFSEDVVKAEIVDTGTRKVVVTDENIDDSVPIREEDLDEAKDILVNFIVAIENNIVRTRPGLPTISPGWARKLLEAVESGNAELLADLKGLIPSIEAKFEGEIEEYTLFPELAKILAKHFPSIVISGLTPGTKIVSRD